MARQPELYLTVEAAPGVAALERLAAALAAAPIASVLIRAREGAVLDATTTRTYVDLVQSKNVAAVIEGDAQLARTLRADGVHLNGGKDAQTAYDEAREILSSRGIIGATSDGTRHSAMALGELGCDYVAFEDPDLAETIAWWSEIFVVPCVAMGVKTPEDARIMAEAGADFIGFALPIAATAADAQAFVRAMAAGRAVEASVEVE